MLGGFLALGAALTFAFNNATFRRGAQTGSAAQAMAITVPLGALCFLAVAILASDLDALRAFSAASLAWLAAAGLVHFFWGRYCNYRATKAMGSNLVGPVQEMSLVWTLLLAVMVVGEALTIQRLVGIAIVVLAPFAGMGLRRRAAPKELGEEVVLAGEDGVGAAAKPAKFVPRHAEGYLFATFSAIAYGTTPIMIRMGLPEGAGFGPALAAGLVSYASAALAMFLVLLWPGSWAHVRGVGREPLKWYTLAGLLVAVSQMLRYMALSVAPVSVVAPIMRSALVFRLWFAQALNPTHEVFHGGVILATALSLLGALVLSTDAGWLTDLFGFIAWGGAR